MRRGRPPLTLHEEVEAAGVPAQQAQGGLRHLAQRRVLLAVPVQLVPHVPRLEEACGNGAWAGPARAAPSRGPGGPGGPGAPAEAAGGGGGAVTHEVRHRGVLGRLEERRSVPHVPGTLARWGAGTEPQPSSVSRATALPLSLLCPCTRDPPHLALGLPLLHQVAAVQPDSAPCGIIWVLGVWGPVGKHVLAAPTQDHLGQSMRARGLGAWQALCRPLRQPPRPPPGLRSGPNDVPSAPPKSPDTQLAPGLRLCVARDAAQ